LNGAGSAATQDREGALPALGLHTLVYLGASLASHAASFLLLPVFTPRLSRAEYGIVEMTDAMLAFLLQLCGFQLNAALTRFHARAADERERGAVVATALAGVSLLTVFAALLLVLAARPAAAMLLDDPGQARLLRLVAVILCAMSAGELALSVLRAERRSLAAAGASLARLALELAAKIALVVGFGLGVLGVLLGHALAAALFLAGALAWLLRRFGARADRRLLAAMALYSAPMVLSGLCQLALHRADRFLLNTYYGLAATGLYGVGYKVGSVVNTAVLGAFLFVWYPFVFGIREDRERRELLSRALLHVPVLICALSLPLALLAPEAVALLMDPKFHQAWRYVPVVLLAYVFWSAFQVAQTPFYVHGKTGRVPALVLAAAAVNLALNVLLLPLFGPMGAAFATLGAFAALALIAWRSALPLDGARFERRRLAWPAGAWLAALLLLYGSPTGEPVPLLLRILLLVVLVPVYLLLFLRRDERAALQSLAARRRALPGPAA